MSNYKTISAEKRKLISKAGYSFCVDSHVWRLDKNNCAYVGNATKRINGLTRSGFVRTLAIYAQNYTGAHTSNICNRFQHMVETLQDDNVSVQGLINYRSLLSPKTEWYLSVLRGFLRRWFTLGHPGLSSEVVELLDQWRLKGNEKGKFVKQLDLNKGPLSDIELQALNEGAIRAYETGSIDIASLAMTLCLSHTGRRQIQITHLKVEDMQWGKNKRGEAMYLLKIPRAKQPDVEFREVFKTFAVSKDLWRLMKRQADASIREVQTILEFELSESVKNELPLFPDLDEFRNVKDKSELISLLQTDKPHIPTEVVNRTLSHIVKISNICSERTGELLRINSSRFRYTIGTRAAREGFGELIIAEILDHSDTQNAGVYIKNIPDHVKALDEAVGAQLAPYAQAFAGVLVDSECMAKRGDDPRSRIRNEEAGVGTCGNFGFCGTNVPIPCYTCMYFQPWVNGPHQLVLKSLLAERERVLAITQDELVANANDRTILAVSEVIQKCEDRKQELNLG